MSEIAISLKNVSKCYRRYVHPADRLREVLLPGKSKVEEFWALRDINLEIHKGQTVGVVGRNGSGKSTMLQIIASTLTPTTGEVYVNGRISALLELGSGFNPEFTGRQNVFFNGKLLGLAKKEVEEKFKEIAAFADIGSFIDQPVKTYSSGMFIRLAFAVSTIIEPDILIVDEALAVGDEAFQRKCFARIKSIQERGGTILFVSHAASSVVELCNSAVLIDNGELLLSGTPKLVISKYQKLIYAPLDQEQTLREEIRRLNTQEKVDLLLENRKSNNGFDANGNGKSKNVNIEISELYDPNLIPQSTISYVPRGAIIENVHITTLEGQRVNTLVRRREYIYNYSVNFSDDAYRVRFGMYIKTVSGFELGGAASHTLNNAIDYVEAGEIIQVRFRFHCFLLPGVYFMNAGVTGLINSVEAFLHRHVDVVMFRVQPEVELTSDGIIDFWIEPSITFLEVAKV